VYHLKHNQSYNCICKLTCDISITRRVIGLVFHPNCGARHLSNVFDPVYVVCCRHFLCPELLLPLGCRCFIRFFPVKVCIAKCSTDSIKRFRCETKYQNEHTFWSLIQRFRATADNSSLKLRPHRALRYVRYVRYVCYVRYTAWPHRKLCFVRKCSVMTEMLADSLPWESSDDSNDELLLLLSLWK
jgi:hypothetical protein